MILKEGDITLRQIEQKDIEPLSKELKQTYFKDKELGKISSFLKSKTGKNVSLSNNRELFLAIEKDSITVGMLSLENFEVIKKIGDINCFILREYMKIGVSKSATIIFMKYLFENINFNELNIFIDKKITSAFPLFEELGFKRTIYFSFKKYRYTITRKRYFEKYKN